jgi:hypothetical protein
MITDTALFRYRHYHSPRDTPDQVNYLALSRVTEGLVGMTRRLAEPSRPASAGKP